MSTSRIFNVRGSIGLLFTVMICLVCFTTTIVFSQEPSAPVTINHMDDPTSIPLDDSRAIVHQGSGDYVYCDNSMDYPLLADPGPTTQRDPWIQSFYDTQVNNKDRVGAWGTDYIGHVLLNGGLDFTLEGGWNCDHTVKGSDPINIWGQMTVRSGSVRVDNVAIYGLPDDDAYEDNDTRETAFYPQDGSASEYNWEQIWLFNINGQGMAMDYDWYRIYVSSNYNRVIIDLQFAHADGDVDMGLYDSSGTYLIGSTTTTDNEYIDYTVAVGGTWYYIRVYPFGSAHGNTYDLWWDDLVP